MKTLYAALGLLALGASTASAQFYDPRYGRERREYRYEERRGDYRESRGSECGEIRRAMFDLERLLRSGNAGGGTRIALGEAREKYARRCR